MTRLMGAGGLSEIVGKYGEMDRWLKEEVSASTLAAWFPGCLDLGHRRFTVN